MKDLLRHELAHVLTNIVFGCSTVQIIPDGPSLVTIPVWPERITKDPDLAQRAVLAGFLGGALHSEGLDLAHDNIVISAIPEPLKGELWRQILEFVKPALDLITDEDLVLMAKKLEKVGSLTFTNPRSIH